MTGYMSEFEISGYDPMLLRQRVDKARVLEAQLREAHSYDKYKPHLDYLELLELKNYMTMK